MTLPKPPILMGAMMGLMLPWMMHMDSGSSAGVVFVLAHVLIVAAVLALALFVPAVRARLGAVRGHLSHLPLMAGAMGLGWAATCAYCFMIGGVHWT